MAELAYASASKTLQLLVRVQLQVPSYSGGNGIHSGLRRQRPSGLRVRFSPVVPSALSRIGIGKELKPLNVMVRVHQGVPIRKIKQLHGATTGLENQATGNRTGVGSSIFRQGELTV
jgi:hypothetical protein